MNTLSPALTYADGIGKIRHENGVIKIDLVSIDDHYVSPGTPPQKIQKTVGTLVMSLTGFEQAFKTMSEMEASLKAAKTESVKEN
ncbi:MAG: hypothetical protein MI743_02980 [Sneathiellales bacterium]|nr:hypothetical protein [Sneathiellales bacterium]